MTAGDILREAGLIVENVTVKNAEDIEKGELIYNDTNGFLAMPNTVVNAKAYVALEEHDYSAESVHTIGAALKGKITVQKVAGTAIKEGQKVMIGGTAGEINLFVKGDAPAAYVEADVQTALDTNLIIVGTCAADAAADATTCDIWLGEY
jgi:predicted RecA/RadA family phage recombinase